MKTRFYLVGILVALLSVSLIVYATSYPGDQTVFYMDYASRYPFDYIIESRNSTYYQVVNGTTGRADVVSTSLSTVMSGLSGTIFFKNGVYFVTTSSLLNMTSGTTIIGESKYGVRIINTRTQNQGYVGGIFQNEHIASGVADYNLTIKSLSLIGQMDAATPCNGSAIAFSQASFITLEDLFISGFRADSISINGLSVNQGGRGQGIGDTRFLSIHNVWINYTGVDGIAINNLWHGSIDNYWCTGWSQIGSGSNNGHMITISGNNSDILISNFYGANSTKVTSTGASAIQINSGINIHLSHGLIENPDGDGIHIESTSGYDGPYRISVNDVTVENASWNSFYLKNGYIISVTNCIAYQAGYGQGAAKFSHLNISNTDESLFSNLLLFDWQATQTTLYGIYTTSASSSDNFCAITIYHTDDATGVSMADTTRTMDNSTISLTP